MARPTLSFVTTIYRSADNIAEFVDRARRAAEQLDHDAEIVLVNDATPDNGLEVACELALAASDVIVVDLARNAGQHKALATGLHYATGDLVMMLDGDLEEDPLWAVAFHERMQTEAADVVYGLQPTSHRSPVYGMARRFFYRALNFLSEVQFPENVTTARLMTRRFVDAVDQFEEREFFIVGLMYIAGHKQVGHEVTKLKRRKSTYSIARLLRLTIVALTSFSMRPLHFIFYMGLAGSALSFLSVIVLVVRYLMVGAGVSGWTSLLVALFFLSGIVILSVGVVAIYVGTIFIEVKRRPRAVVRQIVHGKAGTLGEHPR